MRDCDFFKRGTEALFQYPASDSLGLGCRKGKTAEEIEALVLPLLRKNHLSIRCLARAASVDLKKEEPGILAFCEKYGLEFLTFSPEELNAAPGTFSASGFVQGITGNGKLIQKKTAGDGVTAALAIEEWSVDFE